MSSLKERFGENIFQVVVVAAGLALAIVLKTPSPFYWSLFVAVITL